MVQIGDRFRFHPFSDGGDIPTQTVAVTRVCLDGNFWCRFKRKREADIEIECYPYEVARLGSLEPIEPPRAKQHDEISLEEWRRKIRSMR